MSEGRTRIIAASLEATCGNASQFPTEGLPEFAILGRSNVGKSSLINALAGVNSLARTSKSPGRTQLLHFFKITLRDDNTGDREALLVDFPGFGYAKVSRGVKKAWTALVDDYFENREPLSAVMLLCDSRREPQGEELWVAEEYRNRELLVAMTKCDKLSKSDAASKRFALAKELGIDASMVCATSVLKGKRRGLDLITSKLYGWSE